MPLDFAADAHVYQRNGSAHLWNSASFGGVATLWLDPGYGKTMIVLHTFKALYDAGIVKNMLIIAPLRVAQTVWAQEIEEWASLKGLVACRLHGTKKEKWLERRDVNIWIINYEGIPWATKLAKLGKFPQCDVVVFDEIRRMKNAQGKRFKAARPLTALAKYKWGLTGTPASNGLMDLFGQFLILDDGLALGRYITKYRAAYFEQGYDGFTWIPRPGAQDLIEARIEPYIYRAEGFLDMPEFVDDPRKIVLPAASMTKYRELKKNMILEMQESGDKITAANAAVLIGKLKQMANGRVYDADRNIIELHEAKKDALAELIDELGDEQLLIAYEYNHDLYQLRELLGEDLDYLGAGVNERTAMQRVNDWNSGKIRIMAAHPASAGHGLNLQKGSAHHILWWGPTVDLDHYIQFNRRLLRQGNEASHVVVHTFVAVGTVDEHVIVAREVKDGLQSGLLSALTAEFGAIMVSDEETQPEDVIMQDLQFKADAPQPTANPFAQSPSGQPAPAQQPVQQPAPVAAAPVANPFVTQAPQTGAPVQQQPVQQAPVQQPAPAQQVVQQQVAIQQDVQAPPPPQPDPTTAPPNPFGGQAAGQVVEEAQVVEPVATQAQAVDSGWVAPAEAPAETPVLQVNPAAATASGMYVPINIVVPAEKLDKVLSAIGRAVK